MLHPDALIRAAAQGRQQMTGEQQPPPVPTSAPIGRLSAVECRIMITQDHLALQINALHALYDRLCGLVACLQGEFPLAQQGLGAMTSTGLGAVVSVENSPLPGTSLLARLDSRAQQAAAQAAELTDLATRFSAALDALEAAS